MTDKFIFIKKSNWIVMGDCKYRIILGKETSPLIPEGLEYATWEESWEFKRSGINQPYKENMYWGHYNMTKKDAYLDYLKREYRINSI